jgi:FtsZ-binding cell division protein ZapB
MQREVYAKTAPETHIQETKHTKTMMAQERINWQYARYELQQQNNDVQGGTKDQWTVKCLMMVHMRPKHVAKLGGGEHYVEEKDMLKYFDSDF